MTEVGVGKSKVFKSLSAQFIKIEEDKYKNRNENGKKDEGDSVKEVGDRRKMVKAIHPLYYGAFSSHGPSHDSRFATLTKSETELVYSTYGEDVDNSYAESIKNFSWNCKNATVISGASDTEKIKEKVVKGGKIGRSLGGEQNTPKKANVEAETGIKFLADVAANEREALKKTWRVLKL